MSESASLPALQKSGKTSCQRARRKSDSKMHVSSSMLEAKGTLVFLDNDLRFRRSKRIRNEFVDHFTRDLWLIHWNHVTSLIYLHERKSICSSNLARFLAVYHEWLVLRAVEFCVMRPIELQSPMLVTKPIADEVAVTSIYQH